jgi:hypothetical protein
MDTSSFFAKGFAPCLVLCQLTGLSFLPIFLITLVGSCGEGRFSSSFDNEPSWRCFCTKSHSFPTSRRACRSNSTPIRSATGDGAGPTELSRWRTNADEGVSPIFPPLDHAIVKAIACEVVFQTETPLSRQSLTDVTLRACAALGKPISRSTTWRILHTDAIKPWQYEYWIYPRDPRFADKAEPIVDLYAGFWHNQPLGPNDYIINSDEKTSIQARIRCHPSQGPDPSHKRRLEFEYERGGALQYLAAWDVRRGYVMGRCEPSTGIDPFGRLVAQVMEQEPYCSADRVFWIVDNGSSHRGETSIQRLTNAYPKAEMVHTPVHASWLNQVEIYFSLIQRKLLTPNDFASLAELEQRLHLYEELSNQNPRPFAWKFDRAKLTEFLGRLEAKQAISIAA